MPKISELPAGTTGTGTETFPAVQSGQTVRLTAVQVSASVVAAGALSSFFKKPCIVATTAPISLTGTQTIDGIAVVAGNRVLVKDQASAAANGIYDVASSTWARSSDCDISAEWLEGTMVYVNRGTTLARSLWALTTTGAITIGSSNMTFTLITSSPT